MENPVSYTNDQLQIEISDNAKAVTLRFIGKSILRDPNEFVLPILLKTLTDAKQSGHGIVLDFRDLAYMNSSTMTPVIKILERVRVGEGSVKVLYRKSLKWQDISFSALVIFQTQDRRIEISGVD